MRAASAAVLVEAPDLQWHTSQNMPAAGWSAWYWPAWQVGLPTTELPDPVQWPQLPAFELQFDQVPSSDGVTPRCCRPLRA